MFDDLSKLVPADNDLPGRAHRIDVLTRVLEGTIYDALPYAFHEEKNGAGEYVKLSQRKPSVRTGIIRTVIDDSVSLLFSEGHFPQIQCDDDVTKASLQAIGKDSKINLAFIEAATKGSVGSVCILLRFLSKRVFLTVMSTQYLTPTWNPKEPDKLLQVTELFKVTGDTLKAAGYAIKDDELKSKFWFRREWSTTQEVWFVPQLVTDTKPPRKDAKNTVTHNLSFVPMAWIKNLPGGDDIDGAATMSVEAINTVIECDYQMSQAGRGLKYSSDPTLLIKEPAAPEGGELVRSASTAIVVAKDGDAKLLEISGEASSAVLEYVKRCRELAIERMHGNRGNVDKIGSAQSGRALELLHQPLIWLADRLRASYGESALLDIYRMIVAGSKRFSITIRGTKQVLNPGAELSLVWPAWFPPTAQDRSTLATALATQVRAGFMSHETAVKTIAADFDIEDVAAEMLLINAERQQILAEMPAPQTKVALTE